MAEEHLRAELIQEVLLPFLLGSQNTNGGWGYHPNSSSRVEPTAWAVLALSKSSTSAAVKAVRDGTGWLRRAQLPDGLWTVHDGMAGGTWATAAACLALLDNPNCSEPVARGAAALCKLQPREASFSWRLKRLLKPLRHTEQDFSLRGWSWIPHTASWVIPTSLALILFRSLSDGLLPPDAPRRIAMAEAMLFDRVCPGGGWNIGNPMVYGVAGVPLHEATAWTLLALQHLPDRPEVQRSLAWMESAYDNVRGAASLALGNVCLRVYGRPVPDLGAALQHVWMTNSFLENVSVAALAMLALLPGPDVLRWSELRRPK